MKCNFRNSMANVKIYKCLPHFFCASSYCFRDIKISNFLPTKSKSRSWSAFFFQLHHSMANVKSTKDIFYMFDFHEGVTYANDFNRQTDTYTYTQTEIDKRMAVGEILQICLKLKCEMKPMYIIQVWRLFHIIIEQRRNRTLVTIEACHN